MRLFVDQLTVIDAAMLDRQHGLLGLSYIVDIELEGELDEQSMVMDFGAVKKRIKQAIDGFADHKLLVPRHIAGLEILEEGERVALRFAYGDDETLEFASPSIGALFLENEQVDTESLTRSVRAAIRLVVPETVRTIHVTLREEEISGASYRYAHGLKKHDGACQRIAHGHRSRLRIWKNDMPHTASVKTVAERLDGKYLGTREDIVSEREGRLQFAYRSREGEFSLTLPRARCIVLPGDSTVENIARFLLTGLAHGNTDRWRVQAFEGVQKGAIAESPL